jgi:glycosyltransferase involved in cell wall biosynthesis
MAAAPCGARGTIVHVMTVPRSLHFLRGQAAFLRARGFEMQAITAPGSLLARFSEAEGVAVQAVAMTREITPVRDARALFHVWRALRRVRPRIVHAHTPKGGLLGMLAARLVNAPVRVYHLRGLPLSTASGLRRVLLAAAERTSCALAHRVIAVSASLRDEAIAERLCDPRKIVVLGAGSGNGVDAIHRFHPADAAARAASRARLGIPEDARVVGYVGRLARDKGIAELAKAWRRLREAVPSAHLLHIGDGPEDAQSAATGAALASDARVHLGGVMHDPRTAYAAMDVVALPTYREGFPNVALEAAAMALPIVATRVTGCVDAVQDGVTGTLVPPYDAAALGTALERYLDDPALCARHGEAARRRVLSDFRPEEIWAALLDEYERLLEPAGALRRAVRTEAP